MSIPQNDPPSNGNTVTEPQSKPLLAHHWEQLTQDSGIAPEVIAERGYRSILSPGGYSELKRHKFKREQANLPGLLLPLWTTDDKNGLMVYRPDAPRLGKDGKAIKYELPKGASVRLDCPRRCQARLADPAIPLWMTEGQKKADALVTQGLCAIALLGVWNFKGRNPFGGTTLLADFDYIALNGREVRMVFDNDVMTKPQVRMALDRLTEHLQRKSAHVTAVYLPQTDGKKIGVDDYLLTHTLQDLEGLIEQPRPQPQPADPIMKLLDGAPNRLTRPLMFINRRAYAMTWLWTETTATERLGKDGEIQRLPEPLVTQQRRLFVVRDDGEVFGDVSDPKVRPLHEIGMTVQAPDPPRDDLLWRVRSVLAYRPGVRPDVKDIFQRIVRVYDHFLDFSRSLDEQPRMCQVSACLSLMTWFAEAFTVLPYPWANSPAPGSGKTKWGYCWIHTSYLGYLTSASGSFAALRDLADMGATILFDDAEALTDPRADPDKQALVLAGNRKGVQIPVKEAGPDGRWHTRWLNAYCPRGFTALRLPFPALQSRSIIIPLVASADPIRANRDPEDPENWPLDQQQLRDDLWSLAIALQQEASAIWTEMSEETSVIGRDWERWRSLVAVARLMERHGVEGLERNVRHVMSIYHEEKNELEGTSRVTLVIRGLMRMSKLKDSDVWTTSDVSDVSFDRLQITSSKIVETLKGLMSEQDDEGDETGGDAGEKEGAKPWFHSSRSVGRILGKLRLKKDRDPSTRKRERSWMTSPKDILQLAIAHHLVRLSKETYETSDVVQTSDQCQACGGTTWQVIPGGDAVCLTCAKRA